MAERKKGKTKPKRKIGKKPGRKKKKSVFKKIARYHALFTGLVLATYLAVGFWLGPGALKQDIKGKVAGASTVLSLHIAGPPGKPVITTSASCGDSQSSIGLSWAFTNDTDDYDIYRGGALLASGITNNSYQDESALYGIAYSYYVIANGPLGNTASDAVSVTIGDCIIVKVVAIEGMGITAGKIPEIEKKKPVIIGITNIPHALVRTEIHSGPPISDLITADENGHWEWKVPTELDFGLHTLYVTTIDPNDSSKYKTTQQDFIIAGESAPPPTPIPPPPPMDVACRIMTLDKIDLTNFRCFPVTKKKKPVFSGTANVSNARIQAEISSGNRKVISSFTANENGYWSWGVQGQLKKGTVNIYVKATEPSDTNRSGTCSLRFKVGKAYSKKKMKKCAGAVAYKTLTVPPSYNFSSPNQLDLKDYQKSVFTGDTIEMETDSRNFFSASDPQQQIVYRLVDSENNTVFESEKTIVPDKNGKISESIKVPRYASSGRYKIIAQTAKGDEIVTAEKDIAVKEKSVIELSPNRSLTYAELLSSLGWIVMALTAVLLIFFGLLVFEYHLSRYAVLQVTEGELKKDGYID